ncbi:MAG TPA: hypothetical protein VLG37_04855 [Candidatus Saccharimonadales bacterium]|nr:hypothetical protein [Candidatus Saccharimonadales bacterium]
MSLMTDDKRWIAIRAAFLPLIFILPFFVNHFRQIPCHTESYDHGHLIVKGPCYIISSGSLFNHLSGIFLLVGLGVLFASYDTWQRGKAKAVFARVQIRIAFLSVMLTAIAYAILYQFSQLRYLSLLDSFQPPSSATLAKVQAHPFGVSFPPAFLALFSAFYLLMPFLQWKNHTKDKTRVGGIKKEELFK